MAMYDGFTFPVQVVRWRCPLSTEPTNHNSLSSPQYRFDPVDAAQIFTTSGKLAPGSAAVQ